MFKLLGKVFKSIWGGEPRINLTRKDSSIILKVNRGWRPISVKKLVEKYPHLNPINDLIKNEGKTLLVPIAKLTEFKEFMKNVSGQVELVLDEEVQNLQPVEPPINFQLCWDWSEKDNCVIPRHPSNAQYVGEGWFITTTEYWQFGIISPEMEKWLYATEIYGDDVIQFTNEIIPDWRKRNLPVKCEIALSKEPLLTVKLIEATDSNVVIEIEWKKAIDSIQQIKYLSGYVFSEQEIFPGILPKKLTNHKFRQNGRIALEGDDIPNFLQKDLPEIRQWLCGEMKDLQKKHVLVDTTESVLTLAIEMHEEKNGIGKLYAVPMFLCNNQRIPADTVSRSLSNGKDFFRYQEYWFPAKLAKRLGIERGGKLSSGRTLASFELTLEEVVMKTSERLRGPWNRVEFPFDSAGQDERWDLARTHLEFLRQRGIPGGLIGNLNNLESGIFEMLESLVERFPSMKILLIGTKKNLDELNERWGMLAEVRLDGNKKDPVLKHTTGLFIVTPKALETYSTLIDKNWDLVFVLEVDSLIKTSSSKIFENLTTCRKALTLGLFSGYEFLNKNSSREALSRVFQIPLDEVGPAIWKTGLRAVNITKSTTRPQPVKKVSESIAPREKIAEIVLEGTGSTSYKIPPKQELSTILSEKPKNITLNQSYEIKIEFNYSNNHDKFVKDAKKFVKRVENQAKFIPFMCYWPTYDSMTLEQQKWYFYWRNQVRQGVYPDTDLSYIFVHVYELINDIGIKDGIDGVEQLRLIWLNYRERQPKLDNYLPQWIVDYIMLHQCSIDPQEIYCHIDGQSTKQSLDMVLPLYLKGSLTTMPIQIIEQLCDYRICKSKFYSSENKYSVDEYIPKIIDQVNQYLVKKQGIGIFDAYRPKDKRVERYPFQGAIYSNAIQPKIYTTVVPYSEHQPLKDFLTPIIKHTENKLRELKNFSGRLRGYTLEDNLRLLIESVIGNSGNEGTSSQIKAKIELDLDKLNKIGQESEEIRKILINGIHGSDNVELPTHDLLQEETSKIKVSNKTQSVVRPVDTPHGLLTDLEQVGIALARLNTEEKLIIETLMKNNWEISDGALTSSVPGILVELAVDRINEVALEVLPDILIASENGIKVVTDDFRDELEYLFNLTGEVATGQVDRIDLPEDWLELRYKLSPTQFEVLKVLIMESDPSGGLTKIAFENCTMPELLIDEINEVALDTIGDIIIDTGVIPYTVEAEDYEMVQKIILVER